MNGNTFTNIFAKKKKFLSILFPEVVIFIVEGQQLEKY